MAWMTCRHGKAHECRDSDCMKAYAEVVKSYEAAMRYAERLEEKIGQLEATIYNLNERD